MNKILSIIPTLLFAINSCATFQIHSDKTEDLLPRETEIPGWRIDISPKNYSVKYLQGYIKNPEENRLFNLYGIEELSVAKYKNISTPSKQITIEIFKMNSVINAFGILSIEKDEEYKETKMCDDSYTNNEVTLARKSNYYIKIKSIDYPESLADQELFCKLICDKMKNTSDALPAYLSLFEKKDGRSHLRYLIEGYPKLPELQNIFSRKIELTGKTRTIFFAKRDTSYLSLGELSNLLKNKERQFIMSGAGDLQIAFYKIKEKEFIFVSVFKEWIIGIFDAESISEGERTINILHNDLKDLIRSIR